MPSDYDYEPLNDRTQMFREIDRYTASSRRVPEAPLIARPLTLSERTGPIELPRKWDVGSLDLCRAKGFGNTISPWSFL